MALLPYQKQHNNKHKQTYKMKEQQIAISLSTEPFEDKNKIDWGKITYQRCNINLEQLQRVLSLGFCYTALFKDTFQIYDKCEKNFKGIQIVTFDIDNVKDEIEMEQFIYDLPIKPTIAYNTRNDHQIKQGDNKAFSRFRLLYIFDEIITSKHIYKYIYGHIQSTFNQSYFDTTKNTDNCGKSLFQQFSGNATPNHRFFIDGTFFNIRDFLSDEEIQQTIEEERKNFIDDYFKLEDTTIINRYQSIYNLVTETEITYNEKGFAKLDKDYLKICYAFKTITKQTRDGDIKKICVPIVWRDGQQRRKKLFQYAMLHKHIKPSIKFDELLYNTLFDFVHFIDNFNFKDEDNKDIITKQELFDIVVRAHRAKDTLNIENKKHFKIDKEFCRENNITPKAQCNIVRKLLNDEVLKENYIKTLSVTENLQILAHFNIKASKRKLYDYCEENNINPKGVNHKWKWSYKLRKQCNEICPQCKYFQKYHQSIKDTENNKQNDIKV